MPMRQPWVGAAPPETPVTVTLPYRVMKRVLTSIVRDAHRANELGNDEVGVKTLADASEVIGDAIGAPDHRRFRVPDKLLYAVIAGSRDEFDRWCREDALRNPDGSYVNQPLFVDSVATALVNAYVGWSVTGTAYRRDDFQEILAAVRRRVIRKRR